MPEDIIIPEILSTADQDPGPSHVGIVASHILAAHHLQELVKMNQGMTPVILSDGEKIGMNLPENGRAAILIDLYGLPLPLSEYFDILTATIPGCAFLLLDHAKNGLDVARLLRAGASGFITHAEALYLLGHAIAAIAKGNVWTSPEVMRIYVNLTSRRSMADGGGHEMLTVRECQVLDMLRERYSNKEIAAFFHISESTVKFHISNIFMKLNVRKRLRAHEKRSIQGPAAGGPGAGGKAGDEYKKSRGISYGKRSPSSPIAPYSLYSSNMGTGK